MYKGTYSSIKFTIACKLGSESSQLFSRGKLPLAQDESAMLCMRMYFDCYHFPYLSFTCIYMNDLLE